jgi:hypothetical protein
MKLAVDFNDSGTWTYLVDTYMTVSSLAEFENDISGYDGDIERIRLWVTDSNISTIKLFIVEVAEVLDNVSSRLASGFQWKIYLEELGIDAFTFHDYHSNRVIVLADSGEDDGSMVVSSYSRDEGYYICGATDAVGTVMQMTTTALTLEAYDETYVPFGVVKKLYSSRCDIITEGVLTGLSGLVAGTYYWADKTDGSLTAVKPTSPTKAYRIGTAISTTAIYIKISQIDEA